MASSLINQSVKKQKQCVHIDNIAAVAESVQKALSTSIHRCSQQLNISETSFRQILHKNLGMTPYRVQLLQELKRIDHLCFHFAKWVCKKKIISSLHSDGLHFDLGEYVNKQNCRRRTQNVSLFGAE